MSVDSKYRQWIESRRQISVPPDFVDRVMAQLNSGPTQSAGHCRSQHVHGHLACRLCCGVL